MSGFLKAEFLNTMRQMFRDKKKFKGHIQISNLLKKIKKVAPLLKLKDVEMKVDVKKILIAELALLLQLLIKVSVDLIKLAV